MHKYETMNALSNCGDSKIMKNEQNGSTMLIIVGVLVIALIVGVFFYVRSNSDDGASNDSAATEPQAEQQPEQAEEEETNEGNFEEINLEAINGQTGEGVAIRSVGDPTYTHELYAQTTDPADGKFYEGWLVGDSVISTGKLEKDAEGVWRLTYTSNDDLSTYDEVVITEETEANGLDGVPERHIFEGKFQ